MEDDFFSWSDCVVQLPQSDSLDNQFTKSLSPSLGVNQMWTKRKSDRVPKNKCADFSFNICPKRVVLRKIQV